MELVKQQPHTQFCQKCWIVRSSSMPTKLQKDYRLFTQKRKA